MAGAENTGHALRRSTRVPAEISMRVRSLDPAFEFEGQCKTLLVNTQGCGFQCPRQLPVGIAVLFTIEGRQNTATVLNATALGDDSSAWVIGARLHRSGNFWGLASPPADWTEPADAQPAMGTAATERLIAEKVAAEVERQTGQLLAKLCEQVHQLVAARETDLMAQVTKEMEVMKAEITRQAADQATLRLRETLQQFARQLTSQFQQQVSRQQAQIEERFAQMKPGAAPAATPAPEAAPVAASNQPMEPIH
jgi:hypothetical protein